MGLLDVIKTKLADSEQLKARLEELQAKDKNGELSAHGQALLQKLRDRFGK